MDDVAFDGCFEISCCLRLSYKILTPVICGLVGISDFCILSYEGLAFPVIYDGPAPSDLLSVGPVTGEGGRSDSHTIS
jgi:hypothetical protein